MFVFTASKRGIKPRSADKQTAPKRRTSSCSCRQGLPFPHHRLFWRDSCFLDYRNITKLRPCKRIAWQGHKDTKALGEAYRPLRQGRTLQVGWLDIEDGKQRPYQIHVKEGMLPWQLGMRRILWKDKEWSLLRKRLERLDSWWFHVLHWQVPQLVQEWKNQGNFKQ